MTGGLFLVLNLPLALMTGMAMQKSFPGLMWLWGILMGLQVIVSLVGCTWIAGQFERKSSK